MKCCVPLYDVTAQKTVLIDLNNVRAWKLMPFNTPPYLTIFFHEPVTGHVVIDINKQQFTAFEEQLDMWHEVKKLLAGNEYKLSRLKWLLNRCVPDETADDNEEI